MSEAKIIIVNLQKSCRDAVDIAKTASRNSVSLSGHNFYGDKFHAKIVEISSLQTKLQTTLTTVFSETEIDRLNSFLSLLKSTSLSNKQRQDSLKELNLFCQSQIIPKVENFTVDYVPKTEQVLPFAVVQGTRTYFENMIIQANGCYEHGWYDSCSVMIRKFVESLIIVAFESKNEAHEIKDSNDNFFMLENLINKITTKTDWNLQRDTKKFLPQIKSLGDRSAHNRHYLCTKPDVDKVLSGLRVIADDLLHIANLK